LKITTLETSVAVPFEFGVPSAELSDVAPEVVQRHVQQGKLWHLVAWADEVRREAGFCHKGRCITIPWPAQRAVIGELRPAKRSRVHLLWGVGRSKIGNPGVLQFQIQRTPPHLAEDQCGAPSRGLRVPGGVWNLGLGLLV